MDIRKFMQDLKVNLLWSGHYWYAGVLMQLPIVYDDPRVSTMAVGKCKRDDTQIKLFVNSGYVEAIARHCNGDTERILNHFTEVLKHEVHHLIFGHLLLKRPDEDALTTACELAANSYVNRNRLVSLNPKKPAGIFPEDYDFSSKLPTLVYYDMLEQNGGKRKKPGDGEGELVITLDSHSTWRCVAGTHQGKVLIDSIIRNANRSCRQAGGQWGELPTELKEEVLKLDEEGKAIVPWETALKDFVSSATESVLDYTMRRVSRRYGTRPGTKKDDLLSIAIGIDTSGSIDHSMLKIFFDELYWIDKTGAKITIFQWDTMIVDECEFRDFDGTIKGGGGTDPTDFLDTVEERHFDCAIVFTDLGFGKVRDDYRTPTMWVVIDDVSTAEDLLEYCPVEGTILKVNQERNGFDVIRR